MKHHSSLYLSQLLVSLSIFCLPIFSVVCSLLAMANNMIMASCKTLIPSCSANQTTPVVRPLMKLPQQLSLPKIFHFAPSSLKSMAAVIATSLVAAPPSMAEEIEKAALFDFNLTLPIMMAQFLFLMVALDKIYYTPLGNFMDERDASIKEKLNSVKDTSTEVKQLEEQAAAVLRAARAEISAALNKMKKETQLEVEQKLAEGKKKLEVELQEARANLEKQKEETIKSLDSQIAALSDEIVKKILPI